MVRHEAAEALGGIATPEVLPHLKEWMKREDCPRVVRESCQVAIDMWEVSGFLTWFYVTCVVEEDADHLAQYENSNEFQYADGLGGGSVESFGTVGA